MINVTMESNAGTATMMETEGTTHFEMVEQLAHKCSVTLEEAKAALETANWNVLTATHLLEQEEFRRKQELNTVLSDQDATSTDQAADGSTGQSVTDSQTEANEKSRKKTEGKNTMKRIGQTIMDLIRRGNRNHFVIRRNGEQLVDLPMTILVLLLIGSFGTCAFLLVVGLFLGCQYTISSIDTVEA